MSEPSRPYSKGHAFVGRVAFAVIGAACMAGSVRLVVLHESLLMIIPLGVGGLILFMVAFVADGAESARTGRSFLRPWFEKYWKQ